MPRKRWAEGRVADHHGKLLQALERRFAAFRMRRRGRGCVPYDLRREVLDAIRDGVAPAEIRRCCGLSQQQLVRWQEDADAATDRSTRACSPQAPVPAKVLSVVAPALGQPLGDPPREMPPPEGTLAPIEFEIRLGDWQLGLRLSPVGTTQGDCRCCR